MHDPKRAIAIVGLGVRCAVGLSAPTAAAAVRAGISGLGEHPYLIDKVGDPIVLSAEPTLDPALDGPERRLRLAAPAWAEARAAIDGIDGGPLQTLIGVSPPRPGQPADFQAGFGRLPERGGADAHAVGPVALLEGGHAAGLLAMQQAAAWLSAGRSRFYMVGGVDSYLTPETLETLDDEGMLKSRVNRNGFPPGEAAGFCLLATGDVAREHGLPVLGWIETIASAREPSPIRTRTVCVGRGLSQAIEAAIAPLRMPDDRIDDMICDLNGEPYRSEEFALTVLRTQTFFVDATRFAAPADCWGDVGAASGPLFVALAVAAGLRGYAQGPRTLIWASSENGERAAAVIRRPHPGHDVAR